MANIILVKNYQKRPFSPRAAKIAIEFFGWSEVTTPPKPLEVGTKTKPVIIDKPVRLKEFPIEKANDDLAEIPKTEITQPVVDSGNDDLGNAVKADLLQSEKIEANVTIEPDVEKKIAVKKTRKRTVKSKVK